MALSKAATSMRTATRSSSDMEEIPMSDLTITSANLRCCKQCCMQFTMHNIACYEASILLAEHGQ